jgi:hypothetical protein
MHVKKLIFVSYKYKIIVSVHEQALEMLHGTLYHAADGCSIHFKIQSFQ